MKTLKSIIFLGIYIAIAISCKKDDDINLPPESFNVTAEVNKTSSKLSWIAPTDPESEAISYDIQLNDILVGVDILETTFTLNDLAPATSYSGLVIAKDIHGNSTPSEFSFSTLEGNRAPETFTINTEVNGNSVIIDWTAATDPDSNVVSYAVEIESRTITKDLTDKSYIINDLLYEKTYNGKVIATDSEGASYEESFSFTTDMLWFGSYSVGGTQYNLLYNSSRKLIGIENNSATIIYDDQGRIQQIGDHVMLYDDTKLIGISIIPDDLAGEFIIEYTPDNKILRTNSDVVYVPTSSRVENTKLYTYNGQGQLTEIIETTYDHTSTSTYYHKYVLSYDNNNNIIKNIFMESGDGITFDRVYEVLYSYDDKKNPWCQVANQLGLNNWYLIDQYLIDPTLTINFIENFKDAWISPNNLVSVQYVFETMTRTESYIYNYNDTGYPTSVKKILTTSDGTYAIENMAYYYKE